VVKHAGFTMIELIFAIVIIAFVVMGVPQILERNTQTMVDNLVQEDLFEATRTAYQVLTYPWDDNSIDTTSELAYAKVLDAGSIGRVQESGVDLPFRAGHIQQPNHRRFHDVAQAPANANISGWGTGGYIPETGTGVPIVASGGISNMKIAIITVGNVTFRVYAANIGEVAYASRTF